MNCVEIQDLFSSYLDQACTPEENESVKSHLENCSICLEHFQLTQSLVNSLNSIEEQEVPEGFHNELMHKIHELSPSKKSHFMRFQARYSVVAAAFLFIVIFGVIGSNVLLRFANEKSDAPEMTQMARSYGTDASEESLTLKQAPVDENEITFDSASSDIQFSEPAPDMVMMEALETTSESFSEDLADQKEKVDILKNKDAGISSEASDQIEQKRGTSTILIIALALFILLIPVVVFLWLRNKRP